MAGGGSAGAQEEESYNQWGEDPAFLLLDDASVLSAPALIDLQGGAHTHTHAHAGTVGDAETQAWLGGGGRRKSAVSNQHARLVASERCNRG